MGFKWQERVPRRPYRALHFPEWVEITYCTHKSKTHMDPTPHGMKKYTLPYRV